MQRYLDPTNDSLFKKIFRDLERLKEFINAVLELPEGFRIKEIEFIPVEQVPIIDKGKKSIFDLKVKDEAGSWYIIEMQKRNESDYLKRVQYYSAHSYVQQLTKGIKHKDLLPVIVISLIKTKMFDDEVPCISLHKMLETKTNKQYLFDFSYVFIELKKFDKDKFDNTIDEWLHLFKCAENETSPPANIKSEKVLDAYNVIEMHNLTPEEYDAYIRAKLMEDAEEIALSENFEKGKAEGKAELIQMMLKQGKTVQQIIEFTGLSKEEIEELKAKIENSKAS
ncbi:MAG: Rpn family recombination-promoting nuclease/putative transposase [Rickettsia sp.]